MADADHPREYRAFVSHSHSDADAAQRLFARLEGFRVDKELAGRQTSLGTVPDSLKPIFVDYYEFAHGASLSERTIDILDRSETLIVLGSPAAARNHRVNEEVRVFRDCHPERRIIPLIVADAPADAPIDALLPLALRFGLDGDGAATRKPVVSIMLVADARRSHDGEDLAFARVVAGLTGLDADELYQRLHHQKRPQAMAIAAAANLLELAGGFSKLELTVLLLLLVLAASAGTWLWRAHEQRFATLVEERLDMTREAREARAAQEADRGSLAFAILPPTAGPASPSAAPPSSPSPQPPPETPQAGVPSTAETPSRGRGDSVGSAAPPVASVQASSPMPVFPWPPPAASAELVLPNSIFFSADRRPPGFRLNLPIPPSPPGTVGWVGRIILAALVSADYLEYSFYTAPHGFALVTRLERITQDGLPYPIETGRYAPPEWSDKPFSLTDYIQSLFFAPEGFYRQIVFVVTDQPFVTSAQRMTVKQAEALLSGGFNSLLESAGAEPLTPAHSVTVLIYEYRKRSQPGDVDILIPSNLAAETHLRQAGINLVP